MQHQQSSFRRAWLPSPERSYDAQGLRLIGSGEWRSALCPFHEDKRPSLRVRIGSGSFRCMRCRAHGGDVLSFHMQRYRMGFIDAAKDLGARESR